MSASANLARPLPPPVAEPEGAARRSEQVDRAAAAVPGKERIRRLPSRPPAARPVPVGPGRAERSMPPRRVAPARRAARRMAVSSGMASGARVGVAAPGPAGWRAALAGLAVAVLSATVVGGLVSLAGAVRDVRVPEATAPVVVRGEESLWQVARRVAPSADPGAVAARIAELNGLDSPSVRPGQVLLSPIG